MLSSDTMTSTMDDRLKDTFTAVSESNVRRKMNNIYSWTEESNGDHDA